MAGRVITLAPAAVSITTGSVIAVLAIKAPTNIPLIIRYLGIFAENNTGTDSDSADRQMLWEIAKITAASGTGTAGTVWPIWRTVESVAGTPQLTWRHTFTVPPTYTSGQTLDRGATHPAGGPLKMESMPYGGELVINSNEEIAIKVTNNTGATMNVYPVVRVEE